MMIWLTSAGHTRRSRRQHHVQEDLGRRHRQALRGLDLAARRGPDAGAHDLGGVGAQVDHHGQHAGQLG
jgi:hypothetical protein